MNISKIIEDEGKLNNNLIEINHDNDQINKNKIDLIEDEKEEPNQNSINNNDKILSDFKKLIIPKYQTHIAEINWKDIPFDEEFIKENKPSTEFFLCGFCFNIIRFPKKCSKCEKLFCGKCIDNWLSHGYGYKCTGCFTKDIELREIGINEKRLLNNMIVKCPFNCGEKIAYEKFDLHLHICTHVKRIYTCDLCHESFFKENNNSENLNNHNENCNGILYECNKCFKKLEKNSLEKHKEICKDKYTKCSKCHLNYYSKFSNAHDGFYCEKIELLIKIILEVIIKFLSL